MSTQTINLKVTFGISKYTNVTNVSTPAGETKKL